MQLEEITKSKGKLYSEDVVDACLQLFAKEEFSFEGKRQKEILVLSRPDLSWSRANSSR